MMVNFIKDLKNYLQTGLSQRNVQLTIRDYIPDGQPADNTLSVAVASMKNEKMYEHFDGGKAVITEIDFEVVTTGTYGVKTPAEANEESVNAIREMFEQDSVCDWNQNVIRTDITDYENPHPVSDTDQRYASLTRIQFTVLMPYSALK